MKKRILLGLGIFIASLLSVQATDGIEKNQPVMKTAAEVMQAKAGYALETPTPLQATKAFRADGAGKQKLDSLVLRNDFGTISKDEFKFDSKGNHIKHEMFEKNDNNVFVLTFSRDIKYDENNYEIERIDKHYDFNTGVCFVGTKRNWVVDSDGYVIQENNADLNTATLAWVNRNEFHYVYNQDGNITEGIAKDWNAAGNQYVNSSKVEQTFDEEKNLASYAPYLWRNNEWVGASPSPKYEYEYAYHIDRSDLQTQQLESVWNATTKRWENYARQRFEYSVDGLVINYFADYVVDGEWTTRQYSESTFMDEVYLTSTTVYTANNTGGFDVGVRDVFTFTGIDEETGAHKFVGTREQVLEGAMKKTFDYEFHFIGLWQTVLKEIYMEGTPEMQTQGFEYVYDEKGNPTTMAFLEYNASTKQWRYNSKVEQKLYNFDSNKFTESINYTWNNTFNDWVARSKTEHEYDITGSLVSSQSGSYNSSGTWVVSSGQRTILDYDYPLATIIMPNPVKEGTTWGIGHKLEKMEQLEWDEAGPYATQWMDAYYTTTNITSIPDIEKNNSAYVSDNTLYVNTAGAETINVYTVNGVLIMATQKTEGSTTIDISSLAKGAYIVSGTTGWNIKIIK